ncbi:hypothetical protein ACFV9D_37720 [Streptomyces sp. NPDC059875]|uniref:hypothetical protein n=1 Tax=unclassified Streptomyces TaxID=2593676 RepID=UPI0036673350
MKRTVKPASTVLAACLLLAACGGEKRNPRVTAEQQCDGTVSSAAAPELRKVLDTEKFSDAPDGWLSRATRQVKDDYNAGEKWSRKSVRCKVASDPLSKSLTIELDLYTEGRLLGSASTSFMYPYEMGVEAHGGYRRAYVFTECVSPQLKGSSKSDPARIQGILDVRRSTTPDTAAMREANLIVLHSVLLAAVKELECENNAGLPERPMIKAKKPLVVWPTAPPE